MREIKFRGKCIETGKWVYGGYHEHTKRQINPVGDELKDDDIAHLIIQSGFADWNMPKPLHAIEVDPKTVGQCTGLHDIYNKEIWEGDIIKYKDYSNGAIIFGGEQPTSIGEIKINAIGRGMEYLNGIGRFNEDKVEIIGNIHDNPELLEVRG